MDVGIHEHPPLSLVTPPKLPLCPDHIELEGICIEVEWIDVKGLVLMRELAAKQASGHACKVARLKGKDTRTRACGEAGAALEMYGPLQQ